MKDNHLWDELFDPYLTGQLNKDDRLQLEAQLDTDPPLKARFEQHEELIARLKAFENRRIFKENLQAVRQAKPQTPKILRLWNQLKFNTVSAAAVAIISVFGTLWLSGYYSNLEINSSNYRELRRDVNAVKINVNAQNAAIRNIHDSSTPTPNNFGATGFMLSHLGYVLTNYHVITGADSVRLQNVVGDSYQATVIFSDPHTDLAILKITDENFIHPQPTPYTFKETDTDLGEDVYTLGFPRDESVYGQGYLSSKSGYGGDTTAYQVSIPVNPGNSGGPLLDSKGNVIGIITGKQTGLDGVSFAIKTGTFMNAIKQMPVDALEDVLALSNRNSLSRLSRTEQIKKLQEYVFHVRVY